MSQHEKINYIEFPALNIELTKKFYITAFGWEFIDYGPEYCAIQKGGMEGGFYLSGKCSRTENGSVLVILYSENLEETQRKIENSGGKIVKPIYSFPGGQRFHFSDPNGNELAVWSEQQ